MNRSILRHSIVGACVVAAIGSTAFAQAELQKQRAKAVEQDLEAAMKGEAFAYARYMLYAEQAREHGHPDVAALFERTAKMERLQHFREHADMAGLTTASDADNLRAAIAGERYESSEMYPEMAARARSAGDVQAADHFTEVGQDESKHEAEFAAALQRLSR